MDKEVRGTLKNDLSYAIVPVFGGEQRRLYREAQLDYIISDEKETTNHPIYLVDTGLGVKEIFVSPYATLQRGPYSISLCRLTFPY